MLYEPRRARQFHSHCRNVDRATRPSSWLIRPRRKGSYTSRLAALTCQTSFAPLGLGIRERIPVCTDSRTQLEDIGRALNRCSNSVFLGIGVRSLPVPRSTHITLLVVQSRSGRTDRLCPFEDR